MEQEPRPASPGAAEDRAEQDATFSASARRANPQSPNEALQPETPPVPPKGARRKRRPTLSATSGFLTFLIIATVGAALALGWGDRRLRAEGPLAADKVLYILPGTDLPEIIGMLEHEGVIDDPLFVNVVLLLEGSRGKVRAGEYLFKQGASLRAVIDTLVSGKHVLHAVTIPEGLTSEQIVERLRASDMLAGEIKEVPKEGSLLPETYKFERGFSRADLLRKMQENQKRAVDQVWARRAGDLPLRSPYELVTLASIVEKETGKVEERPRVASVFVNRLQRRMRLQSDPTIVYGLVGGKGTLGRGITRSELDKPTAYNTYAIDGLPPGPIANPGRAALDAVANPARTQDLYFVADGTGGHVFAETLEQHARNVQKWRLIEKEMKERAEDKPQEEVDRAAPQAVSPTPPAPRSDRRGALEAPSVYGALPTRGEAFGAAEAQPPTLATNSAVEAIAEAIETPGATGRGKKGRAKKGSNPVRAFTMSPGLDELGLTVRGVDDGSSSMSRGPGIDGPIGSGEPEPELATFAVPADRRAEQRAKSARNGLPVGADDLPRADDNMGSTDPDMALSPDPATEQGTRAPKIYDVSEGTKLDPLRNKTYDLNFAKTVPAGLPKK
jgi:UPF0755 protein